jgi:hypothetical protein
LQPLLQAQLQVRLQAQLQVRLQALRAATLEPSQAPQAGWQAQLTGAAQSLLYCPKANWRPGVRDVPPAA